MSQIPEFIETVDAGEIEDEGLSFQEYDHPLTHDLAIFNAPSNRHQW